MALSSKKKITWGLVQVDRTAELYMLLRSEKKKKNHKTRPLWKNDWRK